MQIVRATLPESQAAAELNPAARRVRVSQPDHDSARNKHHCAALLQYFRELPRTLSGKECPSTLKLIRNGRFGQRPPNRINSLIRGNLDGHKCDFEQISCGRGVYRWRLREPNRPGYPKDKHQTVLTLPSCQDWYEKQIGKPRPGWQSWPFSESAWQTRTALCCPQEPRR